MTAAIVESASIDASRSVEKKIVAPRWLTRISSRWRSTRVPGVGKPFTRRPREFPSNTHVCLSSAAITIASRPIMSSDESTLRGRPVERSIGSASSRKATQVFPSLSQSCAISSSPIIPGASCGCRKEFVRSPGDFAFTFLNRQHTPDTGRGSHPASRSVTKVPLR